MSMYGDGDYAREKNNIYEEMRDFLENHSISELIRIVSDVIENEKGE